MSLILYRWQHFKWWCYFNYGFYSPISRCRAPLTGSHDRLARCHSVAPPSTELRPWLAARRLQAARWERPADMIHWRRGRLPGRVGPGWLLTWDSGDSESPAYKQPNYKHEKYINYTTLCSNIYINIYISPCNSKDNVIVFYIKYT